MIGQFRGVAAALLGGIALLLASGSAARAQYVDPASQHDYAIKLGAFLPSKSDVRKVSGTEIISLEGDIVIQRFPEKSFVTMAGVGYIERDGFRTMPLTISQVYRDPGSSSAYNYYYGYGLGLYPTRLNTPDVSDKSKILFGAFVLTGIDFTPTFFTELKYDYISKYDNKFIGGLTLSVGHRF